MRQKVQGEIPSRTTQAGRRSRRILLAKAMCRIRLREAALLRQKRLFQWERGYWTREKTWQTQKHLAPAAGKRKFQARTPSGAPEREPVGDVAGGCES